MTSAAVVYLVWPPLGRFPVERFVASYLRQPAGLAHDLVVVNNRPSAHGGTPIPASLKAVADVELEHDNSGMDIGAYARAARELSHDAVLFLNSHSELLAPEWMARFVDALTSGSGVVGASASFESHCTNISHFFVPTVERHEWIHPRAFVRRRLHWGRERIRLCRDFPAFPNPHVRTNAFAMAREDFLRLEIPPISTREDSHLFESGRNSLTRQVEGWGKAAVVVDRDGLIHEREGWHKSNTFRSGDQGKLLVADNRSREYARADTAARREYEIRAWEGVGRFRPVSC